jgi:hypothetical protein
MGSYSCGRGLKLQLANVVGLFQLSVISSRVTPLTYFMKLGCGGHPHTDADWNVMVSFSLYHHNSRLMFMDLVGTG